MTHLPYIAASYILTSGSVLFLTVQVARRLRRARTTLALIETRPARPERGAS